MPKIYCDGNSTLSLSLAFLRLSVALGVDESGEARVSPLGLRLRKRSGARHLARHPHVIGPCSGQVPLNSGARVL